MIYTGCKTLVLVCRLKGLIKKRSVQVYVKDKYYTGGDIVNYQQQLSRIATMLNANSAFPAQSVQSGQRPFARCNILLSSRKCAVRIQGYTMLEKI